MFIKSPGVQSIGWSFFCLSLCGVQNELIHVQEILNPKQPFLAIVAGAKYDTKIGPLKAMYKKVDKLILGGVVYNTFLCAKYGVKIEGVEVKIFVANKTVISALGSW